MITVTESAAEVQIQSIDAQRIDDKELFLLCVDWASKLTTRGSTASQLISDAQSIYSAIETELAAIDALHQAEIDAIEAAKAETLRLQALNEAP